MKNLKYFPFERSRYFYGKLLTVDDFETEQKYMNDKRRMVNRFLHGSGVVCGMNVVRVDDRTISVEMGLALDFAGREIVVDAPVIRKLDMIDGYDDSVGEDGYLYLCIEYAENETEPVHSITGSGARGTGDVEYNKYAEGYRIFFTAQEPENEGFTTANYYQDTKTVYWGNGVRIKQSLRRFVTSGGETSLRVTVENMGQQQSFAFDYDLALTCLQYRGQDKLRVHFDERDFAKAGRYVMDFPLTAMDVKEAEGGVQAISDSLALAIGGKQVTAQVAGGNACRVTAGNAKQAMMGQYYRTAMEDIVRNTYQQSIYLAKISLIQAGPSYYIESVENMPFRQYVFNGSLAAAMNDLGMDEREKGEPVAPAPVIAPPPAAVRSIASGAVVINLGIGGTEGQRFFSKAVPHGLGLGPVHVALGMAVEVSDDAPVIFGSPEVFDEESGEVLGELAAKADVTRGTFTVGLRLLKPTSARHVRISWTAIRDVKDAVYDHETRRIFLRPDVCEMEVRETRYFEAVLENVSDQRVRWSVKEQNGGAINENGMYTAPNDVGVYEISVESVAHPELKASTYVVVRDVQQG
ncbi:MAG: hypothetical protein RR426_04745 [Oscillospiraceae bacterium]